MRKIITVLALLAVVFVGSLALSSPASAESVWLTSNKCHTYTYIYSWGLGYTVVTCVQLRYHTQSDGNGVTVDHVWADVNRNCGVLENDYWGTANIATHRLDGNILDESDPTFYNCAASKDITVVGRDTGSTDVTAFMHYRVDGGHDFDDVFTFTICKGGTNC